MRKLTSTLFGIAFLLSAPCAFAQLETFGEKGTVAFSADRLMGFYKSAISIEDPNGNDLCDGPGSRDCDVTGIGFGMAAGADPDFGFPFNYPRFAFDYFVIDSLSIGGSLGYASQDPGYEAFLFNPRVGYFIGLGSVVGFWPRGGFTYHSVDPDGGNNNYHGFAFTLEAMFAVAPVEHFAFMFGPTIDVDFAGNRECGANDCDKWRQRSFGIQVGLMGWL